MELKVAGFGLNGMRQKTPENPVHGVERLAALVLYLVVLALNPVHGVERTIAPSSEVFPSLIRIRFMELKVYLTLERGAFIDDPRIRFMELKACLPPEP